MLKHLKILLVSLIFSNYSIAQDWNISGNVGTTSGTNFVGTTDAHDLSFKTNQGTDNSVKMELQTTGELGIGLTAPQAWLHIKSGGTEQEAFITDNSSDINTYWKMFRNGNEYGRIYHLAGGSGLGTAFYAHGMKGDFRLGGGSGGIAIPALNMRGGTGTDAGYVGVGDYTVFTPTSLFHIHRNTASTKVDFQMTNAATGATVSDGFQIAVEPTTPNVSFRQQEDQDIIFYTGSSGGTVSERMRIRNGTNNGSVGIGTSSTGIYNRLDVKEITIPSGLTHQNTYSINSVSNQVNVFSIDYNSV